MLNALFECICVSVKANWKASWKTISVVEMPYTAWSSVYYHSIYEKTNICKCFSIHYKPYDDKLYFNKLFKIAVRYMIWENCVHIYAQLIYVHVLVIFINVISSFYIASLPVSLHLLRMPVNGEQESSDADSICTRFFNWNTETHILMYGFSSTMCYSLDGFSRICYLTLTRLFSCFHFFLSTLVDTTWTLSFDVCFTIIMIWSTCRTNTIIYYTRLFSLLVWCWYDLIWCMCSDRFYFIVMQNCTLHTLQQQPKPQSCFKWSRQRPTFTLNLILLKELNLMHTIWTEQETTSSTMTTTTIMHRCRNT